MTEEDIYLESKFNSLIELFQGYNPSADIVRIRSAYECAREAHKGDIRRDGQPFVTHSLAAAEIVAEMGLDEDSIVAALLHDTIEDTELKYVDIERQFGKSVADIVDGVTKLTRVQYTSKEDEQMENLRKMLMAMSKDIRVILIKIADRLHNMRTMAYQSGEKQQSKSFETMHIYAPIAHRLGMQKMKWELEDSALLYLDPEGYKDIMDSLQSRAEFLIEFMKQVEERIKTRLDEWGIEGTVYGRMKHIYSIYRKMYAQQRSMEEIFDICAFRVIVNNIPDCYNVLGHIHDMFKPIPGRFKDYVSTPKPNMYQSVHTTVIGSEGIPFEVQIRTWDMHHTAEYGIAAHWKYKTGDQAKEGDEEKFAWVRRLLETQQESDAQDFFQDLKIDMFADEVFVFTPQGDVINLTAGATPIDFAYAIHSAVGNGLVGAKVNGRIVPISHGLENGDIVEILTSKSSTGPSRDWLKIAKSGQARTKIKQWFKKEKREENIVHGKEMFEAELKRNNIALAAVMSDEILPQILKKISVSSIQDLFASIGYGGMTATRAVNRIKDELLKASKTAPKTALERINEQAERMGKSTKEPKAVQGVLVEGIDNCLVKFSRCCTPIPGDGIVGFITRGYGVSVHRDDCPNYLNSLLNPEDQGRWIDVKWSRDAAETYLTTLKIVSKERDGLIMDIATVLNSLSAKVRSLSAREIGGLRASATVTLEVKDTDELKTVTARLMAISGVLEITRTGT